MKNFLYGAITFAIVGCGRVKCASSSQVTVLKHKMIQAYVTRCLFLMVLFSSEIFACKELAWDEAMWAKNSHSIYLVRVAGISIENASALPHPGESMRESLVTKGMNKEVSFIVYETLKGKPQTDTAVLIRWCGGGEVMLGYSGILFGYANAWHVKLGESVIGATKRALRHSSNLSDTSSVS